MWYVKHTMWYVKLKEPRLGFRDKTYKTSTPAFRPIGDLKFIHFVPSKDKKNLEMWFNPNREYVGDIQYVAYKTAKEAFVMAELWEAQVISQEEFEADIKLIHSF